MTSVRGARRIAAAALVLALLGTPAARAEEVEAALSVTLTAKVTWPTARGDRTLRFRIGTKDLTLALLEQLGTEGDRTALVMRRPLEDLAGENALHYLVVDGAAHDVSAWIRPSPNDLPESYFASARSSVRDADSVEVSFSDEVAEAMEVGDLEAQGFALHLVGSTQRRARLVQPEGHAAGHFFRSVRCSVIGGLADTFPYRDGVIGAVALVTGKLARGPERLVVP